MPQATQNLSPGLRACLVASLSPGRGHQEPGMTGKVTHPLTSAPPVCTALHVWNSVPRCGSRVCWRHDQGLALHLHCSEMATLPSYFIKKGKVPLKHRFPAPPATKPSPYIRLSLLPSTSHRYGAALPGGLQVAK